MSLMKVIEDMIGIDNLNDKMDQNKQLIAFTKEYMIIFVYLFTNFSRSKFIVFERVKPFQTQHSHNNITHTTFTKKFLGFIYFRSAHWACI